LIIDVAGTGGLDTLLDPAAQAIVAEGDHRPIGPGDLDELILPIVGGGGRLEGRLVGLARPVPVGVIGVSELLVFQEPVGRIVGMEGGEVRGEPVTQLDLSSVVSFATTLQELEGKNNLKRKETKETNESQKPSAYSGLRNCPSYQSVKSIIENQHNVPVRNVYFRRKNKSRRHNHQDAVDILNNLWR
jgi:hypothetical protein